MDFYDPPDWDTPGSDGFPPDVNRDGLHDARDVGTMWYLRDQMQLYNPASYSGNDGMGAVGWIFLGAVLIFGLYVLVISIF
jgi:hypothetical protein